MSKYEWLRLNRDFKLLNKIDIPCEITKCWYVVIKISYADSDKELKVLSFKTKKNSRRYDIRWIEILI